ncbi:TonB-linked SusC/RagA family outer membrane protein [Prolixibacter denitrificans]|uniref:TonB-linked SusC/RagA family outer membrane protein n=3 Tax=Prolixibacter denitrificans TaxID=1541063 RepID=A0A2P8C7H1_9BACT|nr:TonB-linked SusC/RagA family outer membrane protein [Prolixibacter denitrificans]
MKNEQLLRKSLTRFFLFRKQMIQIARIMAILMLVFLAVPGFAQNQLATINGTVVGADDGSPIPGATIVVKGTSTGTVSDIDGHFTLQAKPNDVLEASFIGYTTQTIPLNGKTTVTITMKQDIKGLDEVVVIGYGVQKKKLVTGATASVDGSSLQKENTTNALQAMQGKAAGVNITSESGQPGGGFKVNIRGVGTIGNSSPLYVVDGVITNDITYLNNSDIATIDILKDAASCAIYGVNGANGVVLITTKSGSASGKKGGQVTFDAYYGLQNVPRKVDLLNAREYATIQNEAAINSGKGPLFTPSQIDALGTGTNWMNEMFVSNVPTQNYNLSTSGGSDISTYSLGLSYTSQGGIVGGSKYSNYERYNFRSNSERKLYNKKLTVGEHLTFSFKKQKGIKDGNIYNNSFRGAFTTSPLLAMYDSDGNFLNSQNSTVYNGGPWYDGESNPYASMVLTNKNNTKTQTLVGDVYAELEPIKNLKIKTTFGLNYSASAYHSYLPAYGHLSLYSYNDYETITQSSSQGYTWNWDNTVNYTFNLNDHKFDILGGTSVRKYTGSWMNGSNKGTTLFGNFDRAYLSNSEVTTITMSPSSDPGDAQTVTHTISLTGNQNAVYAQQSFFGRLNYNYKETYLASLVFRADGSTMFAKGHQWGYFPSVSLGWVASNASFMEPLKNVINFLKIRGSWGTNGNDAITAFNYLSLIQLSNAQYNFGSDNSTLTQGAYPSTIGVTDTKWETSYQTDLGFDAQFLNNRMSLNVDFYNKKTKNWLIAAPLLATAGVKTNPYINGGDVTNKGVEVQLSFNNDIGKDFHYNVSGSFSYNKNIVNNIPTEDGIIHGGTNILFNNAPEFFRASAGNPIGYFWGYKTDGIFQNEADVRSYTSNGQVLQPDAQPGDVKYVDMNGDGKITADDKTNIGDPNPHEVFGLSFSCNYKNVDFSVTTNGVAGNKIVQSYRNVASAYGNWTSEILSRWHGEGTSNTMPRVTQDNANWAKFSDLYIHDGSYWRISNISLGYDFARLVKWKNLSEFHFYVAAQNLFTFTKYNGMDPEVGYSAKDANNVYSFGQGVDLGFYPRPRTLMVGVNLKF